MQRPEAGLDVAIHFCDRLASELVLIIGEGGFQSLYSRSLHLTSVTFPWIGPSHPSQQTESRCSGLKTSLEGRHFTEANDASMTFLNTFIDILALLIGDLLTARILRSAWGDDALEIA